jgi:predicted transcriptional regulator
MNLYRIIRETSSLTQEEIAQMFGVCQSVVSYYENGGRKPTFDILKKYIVLAYQHNMHLDLESVFGLRIGKSKNEGQKSRTKAQK